MNEVGFINYERKLTETKAWSTAVVWWDCPWKCNSCEEKNGEKKADFSHDYFNDFVRRLLNDDFLVP